jgi:hypothetical protein
MFSEKSTCPPSCESPLKLQHHLLQLLAIWKQIANTGMKTHCAKANGAIVVSFFSDFAVMELM